MICVLSCCSSMPWLVATRLLGFSVLAKSAFQKLVKGDLVLQSCANAFTIPNQTTQIIEGLGCLVMSFLFCGKHADSIETMRYNIFSEKDVSSSSLVTPERLPSTESATKLHCRRVYYQIMVWMRMEEGMDAMNWRWKLLDNRFVPLMSRMNAAPDSLAVTVPLPARPSAAHVEDMDCHVLLSVDRVNLKNMTIHITSSFQRTQMMRINSD